MGTLLYLQRTSRVFTPHFCEVLSEANAIIRRLRQEGIKALYLDVLRVRKGEKAEMVISRNTCLIQSNNIRIQHQGKVIT